MNTRAVTPGQPALLSLMTKRADADEQGGGRTVCSGQPDELASTIAPLAISEIYFAPREVFPGLVWVLGASLLIC